MFKNGTGVLNRYHVNGNLWSKSVYHADPSNFEYTSYDKGNAIFSTGFINNGVNSGIWKIFNSGRVDHEINFVDGSDHFFRSSFRGKVKTLEMEYKHHDWHGQRRYFDYYGKCTSTVNTEMGQLNGYCELADDQIVAKGTYKNGNPVGKWVFESMDGYKRQMYTKTFTDSVYFDSTYYAPHKGVKYLLLLGECFSDFEFELQGKAIYERVDDYSSIKQINTRGVSRDFFNWPNSTLVYKTGLMGERTDLRLIKTFYSPKFPKHHASEALADLENSPFQDIEFSILGFPEMNEYTSYELGYGFSTVEEK